MNYSFTTRLNRLKLHDSSIENIKRVGTDVIIDFDWAYLTDFAEMDLGPLVIGASRILLRSVESEKYTKEKEGTISEISIHEDFINHFETIGENESTRDNQLKISGVYKKSSEYSWVNVELMFQSFEFTWDNYVTHQEWLQGKIPQ
jgi:hypothetical protein